MSIKLIWNAPLTSEELNSLRSASWPGTQDRDWESVFARSFGWVCAIDCANLIGFVNIFWDGGAHAFLLDTTIHQEYQRRGIGTELIQEAIALAQCSGAEWLHVDYDVELDSFYRGCGFRPTSAGLLYLVDDSIGDTRLEGDVEES